MFVRLFNQYFWPDMAVTAQLLTDLAEDLSAAGFQVEVVAGRGSYVSAPSGERTPSELSGNIRIRRLWTTSFGRATTFGRLVDYASFFAGAVVCSLFSRRADLTVCLSTPPLIGIVGALSAAIRGSRFVYKIEDLYPETAVALGKIVPDGLIHRISRWTSDALVRRASAVVVLDSAMARTVRDRGSDRIEVIPNWADGDAIFPDPQAGIRFRECHGLLDRFVALYSGNIGLAHRFDAIDNAATGLQNDEPQVLFLLVGSGPRLDELRAMTTGLSNVRFLPYQERSALRGVYNAADLHIVSVRDKLRISRGRRNTRRPWRPGSPCSSSGAASSESTRRYARADWAGQWVTMHFRFELPFTTPRLVLERPRRDQSPFGKCSRRGTLAGSARADGSRSFGRPRQKSRCRSDHDDDRSTSE